MPGDLRHPSWLELFFDLVFVAAVAALTHRLHEAHSVAGLAVFAGLFVPVWWGWRGFAWYATGFGTEDRVFRIASFVAMLLVAALAAAVPGVTEEASAAFALAYAGLLLVLTLLYGRVWLRQPGSRGLAGRQVAGFGAGTVVWLVSLLVPEPARFVVWAVAMALLIAVPVLVLRQPQRRHDADHIAERYGLFTLIVLGESIVVTVAGLDGHEGAGPAVVAVLGFAIAVAVWWLYFGRYRSHPGGGAVARFAWAQLHLFVFAGIAAAAVGVAVAAEAAAPGGHLDLAGRLPLGAGVAAYLGAMGAIRGVTRRPDLVVALRLGVAGLVLVLGLAGLGLGAVAYVAVVAVLVVAEAAVELLRAPPAVTA